MQANNKLRVFSGNTANRYTDSDIATNPTIGIGAVNEAVADSKLYNSLSLTTTLAVTSLIDFIAAQNPSVQFGQDLSIDSWISAVNNSLVSLSAYTANKTATDTSIANNLSQINQLKDGTIKAGDATKFAGRTAAQVFSGSTATANNAVNVTTNINGKAISTIFESDGMTVKNAAAVNNVAITQDDNGVLKIGDIIIPQKKLIMSTPIEIKQTGYIPILTGLTADDYSSIYEIWVGEDKEASMTDPTIVPYRNIIKHSGAFGQYYTNTMQDILNYYEVIIDQNTLSIRYQQAVFESKTTTTKLGMTIYKIYKIIE